MIIIAIGTVMFPLTVITMEVIVTIWKEQLITLHTTVPEVANGV